MRTLFKRYRDFDALAREMKTALPGSVVPKLPRKSFFAKNFVCGFMDRRQRGLDEFLQESIRLEAEMETELPALRNFLELEEEVPPAPAEDHTGGSAYSVGSFGVGVLFVINECTEKEEGLASGSFSTLDSDSGCSSEESAEFGASCI